MEEMLCRCSKHLLFPTPSGSKPGRKFARDRKVDIEHLKIEVTPDFAARSIAGTATVSFTLQSSEWGHFLELIEVKNMSASHWSRHADTHSTKC